MSEEKKLNLVSITRLFVQIASFFVINFVIFEIIFSVNMSIFKESLNLFPFLQTPRDGLSSGAGILEYILYSIGQGIIPLILIGILIMTVILTGKFFCGWICPVGFIQDILSFSGTKKRNFSINADKNLKKIKYWIISIIIIILSVLGILKQFNELSYFEFSLALGGFLKSPLAGFSLSEFIFYRIPDSINSIIETLSFDALFEGGFLSIFSLIFYIVIIALAVYYPRFYCRVLCPYGAVSGLISRFSFLKFKRNPVKCVGRRECGECEDVCPLQIRILDEPFEGYTGNGECNLCGKCSEKCPYDAIKLNIG